MPTASVVIPVYNGERFIRQAVGAALAQTFQDCEIIVIDDGSTDGTRDVIFENFPGLIEKKIRYLRNDRNRERAYSRNRGASESKGEFIFFLDADDEWEPLYVEKTIEEFQRGNYDVVYSFQRTFVNEEGEVIRVSRKPMAGDAGETIFSSLVGYPTATAFRRRSFPEYRDRYIPREDWEIFLRAYLEGLRIRIVDNDMIKIRSHGGRTSKNVIFWSSTKKVYDDYRTKVPEEHRGTFLFHVGEVCFRFGDLAGGWRHILQSLAASPGLLTDMRRAVSVLKRGFRFDKYFRFYPGRRSSVKPRV